MYVSFVRVREVEYTLVTFGLGHFQRSGTTIMLNTSPTPRITQVTGSMFSSCLRK